ncbi:MAG TPA: hypothetical protein VK781_02140 [Solirubrobacteraceae bacterium]|nr:hypothetical protein [Solirubrobacteraceae bacterium]
MGFALGMGACKPATVAEAEAKGNVAWLDQNGSPEAIAALGRLADSDPKAIAALQARAQFEMQPYKAAWVAVIRGAPWGTTLLHAGLADPKRADVAASAMQRHEPHLAAFVADLESALSRLSASQDNVNISSTLASVGPLARPSIERLLTDASTRGAMCRGIASGGADADARKILVEVPESARDDVACVDAVVRVAATDDAVLTWLAERGEPGILGAAGKGSTLACPLLHVAWAKAFAARTPGSYPALTVPLSYATKRCPADLDGVLADTLQRIPAAHETVLRAIDPFDSYGDTLRATCASLPAVTTGRDTALVKERASDALMHACKPPG